jgi:hypothetical protein
MSLSITIRTEDIFTTEEPPNTGLVTHTRMTTGRLAVALAWSPHSWLFYRPYIDIATVRRMNVCRTTRGAI